MAHRDLLCIIIAGLFFLTMTDAKGYQRPWSIKRDRLLTCNDFARNAEEVLGGKEITVFSTKIEGIGM